MLNCETSTLTIVNDQYLLITHFHLMCVLLSPRKNNAILLLRLNISASCFGNPSASVLWDQCTTNFWIHWYSCFWFSMDYNTSFWGNIFSNGSVFFLIDSLTKWHCVVPFLTASIVLSLWFWGTQIFGMHVMYQWSPMPAPAFWIINMTQTNTGKT